MTKLRLNPKSIPDLDWQLASELHPNLALYKTAKITDQITATTQATSIITAEIVTKSTKLKEDLNPSFIHFQCHPNKNVFKRHSTPYVEKEKDLVLSCILLRSSA